MRKKISKNCLFCADVFEVSVSEVNRGAGKFCSRSCGAFFNGGKRNKRLRKSLLCEVCGKNFYRVPHELKSRPCRTCSKSCAAILKGRENPPNLQHGGYTNGNYRKIAFAAKEKKCERCGWNIDVKGIEVHHKDRDRKNSKLSNLEVLCAGCHRIEHWGDAHNRAVKPVGRGSRL